MGWTLQQREVRDEARHAWVAFVLWWYAFAGSNLAVAVEHLAGAMGVRDTSFYTTIFHVRLLVVIVSLWGLLYYLLYLWTGSRRLAGPLTVAYVVYYGVWVWTVATARVTGIAVGDWDVAITYATPLGDLPWWPLLVVLLVVPQIVAAFAYLATLPRLQDPSRRYRVTLVSGAILVWFGTALLAGLLRLNELAWWEPTARSLSLFAALAVLLAYRPPAWVRRRLGVHALDAT